MELENLVKLIQTVSDSDLTGFQYEENGVKLKIQKEKEQMVVSTGAAQLTTVQNVPGVQSNAVSALLLLLDLLQLSLLSQMFFSLFPQNKGEASIHILR